MEISWIDTLKSHLFIVIGYEHYNPLGVIRSLGENGIEPVFIVLNEKTKIASTSRYIKKLHVVEDYDEALRLLLKEYSHEAEKPFLIPCDDNITELLDLKYEELKDHFYFSNGGEAGRIARFMNKDVTDELAERVGLLIPGSWVIRDGAIPDGVEYPVITKPLTSYPGWKDDYYICKDRQELAEALGKIKSNESLVQHFIKKKYETCMDGVAFNGGQNVFISNYSHSAYVLEDYYSLMNLHNELDDPVLYEQVCALFRENHYEGIFSVDFLVGEDDRRYFLEINYRNSAYSYASTKLGMNLPLLWAYAALNGELPPDARRPVPKDYISLAEITDLKHRVLRLKKATIFQWLRDVRRADCLLLWNSQDKQPGLYLFRKVLGRLHR